MVHLKYFTMKKNTESERPIRSWVRDDGNLDQKAGYSDKTVI